MKLNQTQINIIYAKDSSDADALQNNKPGR